MLCDAQSTGKRYFLYRGTQLCLFKAQIQFKPFCKDYIIGIGNIFGHFYRHVKFHIGIKILEKLWGSKIHKNVK